MATGKAMYLAFNLVSTSACKMIYWQVVWCLGVKAMSITRRIIRAEITPIR